MGYLGEEIRKLGFGLMRLPQKDGAIDVEQVKEMVDLFMDAGFIISRKADRRTHIKQPAINACVGNVLRVL